MADDNGDIRRRSMLKTLSATSMAAIGLSSSVSAQRGESEDGSLPKNIEREGIPGLAAPINEDTLPDGVEKDDIRGTKEERPTLVVNKEKQNEITARYNSAKQVEKQVEIYAKDVLEQLDARDFLPSSDIDQLPLQNRKQDRYSIGYRTDVEGVSVTALNQEGTDTALLSISCEYNEFWVTLMILPELEQGYALVKDSDGKVTHVEPENGTELITDGGCEPGGRGGLCHSFTDCTNATCVKYRLGIGFLGTEYMECSYENNCITKRVLDSGCIC